VHELVFEGFRIKGFDATRIFLLAQVNICDRLRKSTGIQRIAAGCSGAKISPGQYFPTGVIGRAGGRQVVLSGTFRVGISNHLGESIHITPLRANALAVPHFSGRTHGITDGGPYERTEYFVVINRFGEGAVPPLRGWLESRPLRAGKIFGAGFGGSVASHYGQANPSHNLTISS